MTKIYLTPKTIEVPVVTFLESSYIPAYLDSVKSYNSEKARQTLGEGNKRVSAQNGLFAGSSPFIQLQLLKTNNGEFPNKTKPITRPTLEQAVQKNPKPFQKKYTDFGLAIWQEPEDYKPNKLSYKLLTEQFKKRNLQIGNGKLIYFSELELRESQNSKYGLTFSLKDIPTENLKDLIKDVSEFLWVVRKGKGFASVFLCDAHEWDSGNYNLSYSNSVGRVVGVGMEEKNLKIDIS